MSLDSSGVKAAASGNVTAPELPKLGVADATSAPDDAKSRALPAVAKVSILGTRVSKSFHKDGILHVVLIPRDASDKAILDANMFVSAHVKANVPFPIKAKVRVASVHPPVAAEPFQLAVDIDSSGSMSMSDKGRSRVPAAKRFVEIVAKDFPKSEFAVWDFDNEVRLQSPFTIDLAKTDQAIDKVKDGGGTALHQSVMEGLVALEKAKKPGFQQGLVVLTDGQDNSSKGVTKDAVIAKAKADKIPIFGLALGGATDIPGLSFVSDVQEYATETGGVFAYSKGPDALGRAFESMAMGATKGTMDIELNLAGGTYLPFSTLTVTLGVKSGGKEVDDSLELIVPLGG